MFGSVTFSTRGAELPVRILPPVLDVVVGEGADEEKDEENGEDEVRKPEKIRRHAG